jgi:DNA-binding NarL/FixJ family response regulator
MCHGLRITRKNAIALLPAYGGSPLTANAAATRMQLTERDLFMKVRVILADDHTLFLEGLKKLLEPSCWVIGTATDGQQLISVVEKQRPEVVVTDINMPRLNGLEACERLLKQLPQTRIVVVTVDEDLGTAEEAIRRGASGYVLKKSATSELVKAIHTVMAGRVYVTPAITRDPVQVFVARAKDHADKERLTARQREVLQLLAEGKSMKEAADVLQITPRTIAFHKYSMMHHLGVTRNSELVLYAVQSGLCRGQKHC